MNTWSCSTLWDPMDCNPPGSFAHGILQTRMLEWFAMPSSRGSSQCRDWTWVSCVSCIGKWILYHCATWEAQKNDIAWGQDINWLEPLIQDACLPAKSLQSCLTLCDPMDCSLPGSSVHGILQAIILEWVAISSSRGSSRPRDRILYLQCHLIMFRSCSIFLTLSLLNYIEENNTCVIKMW